MSHVETLRDIFIGKDGENGVLFDMKELDDGKAPEGAVMVDGCVRSFGFHPERLERVRPKVVALIREVVQDAFMKGGGEGWSMLNLAEDREGNVWGGQRDADDLLCLAIGLKMAGFCMPRSMWSMLPGGMPYVWFDLTGEAL